MRNQRDCDIVCVRGGGMMGCVWVFVTLSAGLSKRSTRSAAAVAHAAAAVVCQCDSGCRYAESRAALQRELQQLVGTQAVSDGSEQQQQQQQQHSTLSEEEKQKVFGTHRMQSFFCLTRLRSCCITCSSSQVWRAVWPRRSCGSARKCNRSWRRSAGGRGRRLPSSSSSSSLLPYPVLGLTSSQGETAAHVAQLVLYLSYCRFAALSDGLERTLELEHMRQTNELLANRWLRLQLSPAFPFPSFRA
jgi:hypothetical protein